MPFCKSQLLFLVLIFCCYFTYEAMEDASDIVICVQNAKAKQRKSSKEEERRRRRSPSSEEDDIAAIEAANAFPDTEKKSLKSSVSKPEVAPAAATSKTRRDIPIHVILPDSPPPTVSHPGRDSVESVDSAELLEELIEEYEEEMYNEALIDERDVNRGPPARPPKRRAPSPMSSSSSSEAEDALAAMLHGEKRSRTKLPRMRMRADDEEKRKERRKEKTKEKQKKSVHNRLSNVVYEVEDDGDDADVQFIEEQRTSNIDNERRSRSGKFSIRNDRFKHVDEPTATDVPEVALFSPTKGRSSPDMTERPLPVYEAVFD